MPPIKMIYYREKKLKKRLQVLKANNKKKHTNIDLTSLAQRIHFLQEPFQMTAIALVCVINYHINGVTPFLQGMQSTYSRLHRRFGFHARNCSVLISLLPYVIYHTRLLSVKYLIVFESDKGLVLAL